MRIKDERLPGSTQILPCGFPEASQNPWFCWTRLRITSTSRELTIGNLRYGQIVNAAKESSILCHKDWWRRSKCTGRYQMNTWLRHIRGAVLMALAWAVVWAPVGVLIGMIVDPSDSMEEMWVAVGAYPGFLCGAVFSTVLGIAEGRRRFDELSLSRVGAWGAMSGLLVGVLPFVVGTLSTELPLWLWGVVIIGPVTLLSSVSAVGSALLARMAKKRELRDASADVA